MFYSIINQYVKIIFVLIKFCKDLMMYDMSNEPKSWNESCYTIFNKMGSLHKKELIIFK